MTTKAPLSERMSYSVRETASLLGCGHNSVYSLIRAGRLRTVQIGRRVFVRRDEIDRFLKESEA